LLHSHLWFVFAIGIKLLWFDITNQSATFQKTVLTIAGPFLFLCSCFCFHPSSLRFPFLVCFFFGVNGYIEEYAFKQMPDFKFSYYMTMWELIFFTVATALERTVAGEAVLGHKVHLKWHLFISVFMALARGLTNGSLQYLNYPTQVSAAHAVSPASFLFLLLGHCPLWFLLIRFSPLPCSVLLCQVIFKSGKLLTTMVLSCVWLKHTYTFGDIISAILLVCFSFSSLSAFISFHCLFFLSPSVSLPL
jgi:hypothetical protein